MSMLRLNRVDGKKMSKKRLEWTDTEIQAFNSLKLKLSRQLELYLVDPDRPFVLRTDASDYAIGAALEQQHPDKRWADVIKLGKTRLVPVSFYSRKLAKSQLNWIPREKETYAIVAALRKWAGYVWFQPVVVATDRKSLGDWATEHFDTT